MPFDIHDFETLMALDDEGGDVFVGRSPAYPWGRVYGGQVVAQALRAASNTVPADRFVHSLHVYFIRGGDSDLPIRYAVERVRDGGSFSLRSVVASQSSATMMQMTASFQVDETGIEADVQEGGLPGGLPEPDALEDVSWGPILDRRRIAMKDARAAYWMRIRGMRTQDPAMQACALAFASDDVPTEAANQSHPLRSTFDDTSAAYDAVFLGASLDHAIWFHRPAGADDWLLYATDSPWTGSGRGFNRGRIFNRAGELVASVAQEGMMRKRVLK